MKNSNRIETGLKKNTSHLIAIQVLMTLAGVLFLVPIYTIFNYSFKTKKEIYLKNPLALAESLDISNYVEAFKKLDLLTSFGNTFFYTAMSVLALVILSGLMSWAIARSRHKFYKFVYVYLLLGILIPPQALFLPIYIVGYKLSLTNTRIGMILIYIASGLSFAVFIMTSFMSTVPVELEEAAKIDGCSMLGTFFRIVLPMLRPAIATLVIILSFQIWNDYLMASLFVSDNSLKTLTVAIKSLFSQQASDYSTAFASIVLATLPQTVLFIYLQKYFIKGMTVGSVKG